MDKKGALSSVTKIWIGMGMGVAVLILLLLISYGWFGMWENVAEPVWLDTTAPNINWASPIGWALTYVFGIDSTKAQTVSALVVLIAVWVIFFVAFGDIVEKFGFFSQGIGWLIGFAMAIILANLNMYYSLLINLMSLFSFLAAWSVIAALGSIFFAMIVVYFGISPLGGWLMNRKAMYEGATARAGGTELAGTISGLKAIGKALKEKI